jgi:hypothetical protein
MTNLNPRLGRKGIPHKLGPRSETIAYLIWCAAEPHGWDVTLDQLVEETGCASNHIGRVLRAKGWLHRIRATYRDDYGLLPGHGTGYRLPGDYRCLT